MSDSRSFNPERLSIGRERRSLNKTQLAHKVSMSAKSISAYERGQVEPTEETVGSLARCLGFPADFFFQPQGKRFSADAASFRSLSRMTAGQRNSALAVGELGVVLNEWIEEEFEVPQPDIPDLQPGMVGAEDAAAMVRNSWGLGVRPIPNMLHLLELHGVRIFSLAEECKEIDAFSFWVGRTPYLCVSVHKTAERAIFDAAHELGHLVLHRGHSSPRGRQEEKEADQFASHFLMPTEDVQAHAPRNATFDELVESKRRWRVSVAALNYRLTHMGWSTEWHGRSIFIELSRRGRNDEPRPVERERSQLLEKVFEAMRTEGLSRSDIAHKLSISIRDLDALTFGLTIQLQTTTDPIITSRRRSHLRLVSR